MNLSSKSLMPLLAAGLALTACSTATDRVSVAVSRPTVPVLTLKPDNRVLDLTLVRTDSVDYRLSGLSFSLDGTTEPASVVSAALLFEGDEAPRYATTPKANRLSFAPDTLIASDTLRLSLTLTLADDAAGADNRLAASLTGLQTSLGSLRLPPDTVKPLRIGVALRRHGQDGVNTSRIPGLVTTNAGTLIALYDARNERDDDLQGDIDIAINRSTDGGLTWQPIQRVIDMGTWGNLPQRYNGVSDGSLLVDPATGTIFATGLWMHGVLDPASGRPVRPLTDTSTVWNHQWRSFGSQPGYDIDRSSQFLIARSTDDGLTWSEPVNITRQVKRPEWWLLAPAPGRGIALKDGTLVFPAEGRDAKGTPFSTIIYSKDGGEHWTCGEPATWNTNECQVVELSDGSLMLNARHRANRRLKEGNGRAIAVSSDLGKTWSEHSTSRSALIEPACQASLYRHDYERNGEKRHVLLFSNPSDTDRRINHTIKVSFDDGQTWPEEYWTLLDEEWGAGYSCLTSIDPETIGIFYEGSGADILFLALPLRELLKEE